MPLTRFAGCGLVIAFTAVVPALGAESAADKPREKLPEFSVTSLSVWEFGKPLVHAVNDQGSAIGNLTTRVGTGTRTDAFFRPRRGADVLLGQLPGGDDSTYAIDINERDWAVGFSSAGPNRYGSFQAVVWNERDGLVDLGVLPGGNSSMAEAINNHNQVVGYSDSATQRRAFIWAPGGRMTGLAAPAGSGTDQASDINDKGTVVGHAYRSEYVMQHASLWTRDGVFYDLGELPGGPEEAAAFAVNEADHVVGYSLTAAGHRAFFWSQERGMLDLGALPGTTEGSVARDINKDDWVVGTSRSPGPTSAGKPFLWTPEWGLRDLNIMLDEQSRDWRLYESNWVNDKGEILAVGQRGDEYHILLLSPHNPEPGLLSLLAAGAVLCLLRRRDTAGT